jgi:multimeric flavodoxin WrbA
MNSTARRTLRQGEDAEVLDGGAPADGCVLALPKNFHTVTASFKRFTGIERATGRLLGAGAS